MKNLLFSFQNALLKCRTSSTSVATYPVSVAADVDVDVIREKNVKNVTER